MTFFARPNLEDLQFRQESGSTLTLSGTTHIVNITGLTLDNGSGTPIPITAEGAGISGDTKHLHSLVYNHSVGRIELLYVSGGTGCFTCGGGTTCTVGGINAGTVLSGYTYEEIFEEMLFPTTSGVTTNPYHSFSISPTTTVYEIGTGFTLTGTISFNRGLYSPAYDSSGTLISTGCTLANTPPYDYCFCGYGATCGTLPSDCISSSSTSVSTNVSLNMPMGDAYWCSFVSYPEGADLYNSKGIKITTFPSGSTTPINKMITGIFPYYYGKICSGNVAAGENRPTYSLIESGITALNSTSGSCISDATGYTCKVVASSNSTINIDFNSTYDDYIWFAIPSGSTSKTCWYVNALNNGSIGGVVNAGGNLFPDECVMTNIESDVWVNTHASLSPQSYKIYISNYQTASTLPIQLRNS